MISVPQEVVERIQARGARKSSLLSVLYGTLGIFVPVVLFFALISKSLIAPEAPPEALLHLRVILATALLIMLPLVVLMVGWYEHGRRQGEELHANGIRPFRPRYSGMYREVE